VGVIGVTSWKYDGCHLVMHAAPEHWAEWDKYSTTLYLFKMNLNSILCRMFGRGDRHTYFTFRRFNDRREPPPPPKSVIMRLSWFSFVILGIFHDNFISKYDCFLSHSDSFSLVICMLLDCLLSLILIMKKEAVRSSETSVSFYQTTRRYIL
jgi:hypothetical protein